MTTGWDPARDAVRYNTILDGLGASRRLIAGRGASSSGSFSLPPRHEIDAAFAGESNPVVRSQKAGHAISVLRATEAGLIEARLRRDMLLSQPVEAARQSQHGLAMAIDVLPVSRSRRENLHTRLSSCDPHLADLRQAVVLDAANFGSSARARRRDAVLRGKILVLDRLATFRVAVDALPVGRDIRNRLLAHLDAHIKALEAIGTSC